ncbi:DUF1223 domain-containing protein [Flavobacterium hauense]
MKNIKLIQAFILFALFAGMNVFGQNNTNKSPKKGIAVLELFTSEGCSSCPPADALMGRIQSEYKDREVYVLAYHVDYWDSQGWKDIFSNTDYTRRQYDYAKWLNAEPIYTPQVVINGKSGYIGSQESIVRSSMAKELSKPSTAEIVLKATQKNDALTVSYVVNGASKSSLLRLAVVQKTAQSNVKRGENSGRLLYHYQIVRRFNSTILTATGKGSTEIKLPKDFNTKDFEVIGFVQDTNTGVILGADKAIF